MHALHPHTHPHKANRKSCGSPSWPLEAKRSTTRIGDRSTVSPFSENDATEHDDYVYPLHPCMARGWRANKTSTFIMSAAPRCSKGVPERTHVGTLGMRVDFLQNRGHVCRNRPLVAGPWPKSAELRPAPIKLGPQPHDSGHIWTELDQIGANPDQHRTRVVSLGQIGVDLGQMWATLQQQRSRLASIGGIWPNVGHLWAGLEGRIRTMFPKFGRPSSANCGPDPTKFWRDHLGLLVRTLPEFGLQSADVHQNSTAFGQNTTNMGQHVSSTLRP